MLAAPPPVERRFRYWSANGWWGDQGQTPECVAYAWVHYLEDGPIGHSGRAPVVGPHTLYGEAQQVDEWPGEDYDGTSVRAGAKVLATAGFVGEYRWAWDVDTVVTALLTTAPVVLGTNWYSGMFDPTNEGQLIVGGDIAGGHAYVANGVNRDRGLVRIKNSWGRGWGIRGHAWIALEDLDRLIREDGEACLATEVKT